MDWLEGLGWSGLATVAFSVVWDFFFPLSNLLIICVFMCSIIVWVVLEKLQRTGYF